jgi:predicted nuclease of predicted toxin-antitoxin system
MLMGRFYADENFPWGAVLILRSLGHDVLTVQEAGRRGSADLVVLTEATANGRAVLTHNHRHFKRLHARGQPHAGIVSCTRDDNDLPGLAQRVHDASTALPNLANQFIRIIRPNPPANPSGAAHGQEKTRPDESRVHRPQGQEHPPEELRDFVTADEHVQRHRQGQAW